MTPPAYPADAATIDPNRRIGSRAVMAEMVRPPTRERRGPESDTGLSPPSSREGLTLPRGSQRQNARFGDRRPVALSAPSKGLGMLAQQFHTAVTAARSRAGIDDISRLVWRALAEGHLNEIDAEAISVAVEARRASMRCRGAEAGYRPSTSPAGGLARSHCRSPDRERSIRRRRSWVASGWMPPQLAAHFTPAEAAALAVVAEEVRRNGRCEFPLDKIAAVAGVSRSSVRNALRSARLLGLVSVMERRHRGARSETNVIAIVSAEWLSWLDLGEKRRGGWGQNREHHESKYSERNESRISKRKAVDADAGHLWRNWSHGTICSTAEDRRLNARDRQLSRSR